MNSSFRRSRRSVILAIGLLSVSAAALLAAEASRTTVIAADRELRRYWRGFYDILVRPAGARSTIEDTHGLVEANHLSGIFGGIGFEQYETIKSIPGVEVAAPIAMIGFVGVWSPSEPLQLPRERGVYALEQSVTVDDGARTYVPAGYPERSYLFYAPDLPALELQEYNAILHETGITFGDRTRTSMSGGVSFPVLIAGIDPDQEAALVGLDRSVVSGRYLRSDETLENGFTFEPVDPTTLPPFRIQMPVLINTATYVNLRHQADLERVMLPLDVSTLDDIQARGGIAYLETQPIERLARLEMDSGEIYDRLIKLLTSEQMDLGWTAAAGQSVPGALSYDEALGSLDYPGLTLALRPPLALVGDGQPRYRASVPLEQAEFEVGFMWEVIGTFDIERLPRPDDVIRLPLETYFPPVATLLYDEEGGAANPPRRLSPSLGPEGYLQPPPLVLTTLDAARAVRGENAISAIRVRVGGIEDLSPTSQRKIEAVAIEIARSTGLTVDIVVGSSPARVLVNVPGIGYVEEQWIQKGVNLTYREGIQAGSWLLIGTVVIAGTLFTLDLTWAEVMAQRRWIALQKALGWRSSAVFGRVIAQVLSIAAASIGLGTAVAWLTARLLRWAAFDARLLLGLPFTLIALAGLAGLPPAWSAGRVSPAYGISQLGYRHWRRRSLPAKNILSYAWNGIARRPDHTLLGGTVSSLAAALLVLLLAVTLDQRGMLSGTLLGEFILQRIQGFHYAIAGISLGLAALSIINSQLTSVMERRQEIGVLKAVGWRTQSVSRLFVSEGSLLGLTGGTVGALLGSAIYFGLYQELPASMAVISLAAIGAATLAGALAALYPAKVAARVPPAEAVRHE